MRSIMIGLLAMSTLACGGSQQAVPLNEDKPMPVAETVFAPAVGALDKARTVQGTLQQEKDNTDAQLKAAE